MLRAVMIGAVRLSEVVLEELLATDGVNVVGVVSRCDDDYHADWANLIDMSLAAGVPCAYIGHNINEPGTVQWIADKKPDVIFCCGWSQIIREPLLSLPRFGCIGYHPSMLPEGRGRHPIIWALALGLERTGSTFFRLAEGADTGDIILQTPISIVPDDDAQSLYDKICATARSQLRGFLSWGATLNWPEHSFVGARQEVRALLVEPSTWRKRDSADARIDWRMSTRAICNLVRALRPPYRGARCTFNTQDDVTVWSVRDPELDTCAADVPGCVLGYDAGEELLVKTGDGVIALIEFDIAYVDDSSEALPEPKIGDHLR